MLKKAFKTPLRATHSRFINALILLLLTNIKLTFAEETPETLAFTVQPLNMCLQKDSACTLSCRAECGNSTILYKWFSTNAKGTTKTPITNEWSVSSNLAIESFTEKEIRYYICGATVDQVNIVYSKIVAAAYTGLPIIKIETVNHEEPTADKVKPPKGCYGHGIKNATKVPAKMQILYNGNELYDSGEYEKKKGGLTIKLRGNASAYGEKKPYKLKLQKKADLLASLLVRNNKKYQDKDWILHKGGTNLNTFVGMAVADIAGTPWTPEFAFVNVVFNGEYRGIYLLIESINKSEKRVDVADNGYIIERDAYWWNEDVKFITTLNQKYTFKYPDTEDIIKDESLLSYIKAYIEIVETQIQLGTYEDYIDTESFARWQLIHDILGTWDSGGSNIFISKYDNTTPEHPYNDGSWSKLAMSTPWDFDSNYRMKNAWANEHDGARMYSKWLFSNQNSAFFDSYQTQWNNISDSIWPLLLEKLNNLKDSLGEDINISRELDAIKWNIAYNTLEQDIETANEWFTSRIKWLNKAIGKMKKVIEPDFSQLTIKSKLYDGTDNAIITGNIAIKNPSSISVGNDVSINIISAKYDSPNTDAKSVIISFELVGKDKEKYKLSYKEKEIQAAILPKTLKNRIAVLLKKDF